MKAILLSVFVALLMVGCGEEETEFERIKRLAEEGDKVAQRTLGYMFWNANGAPLDYEEAVKWNTKSAEQGYAEAQHDLGEMYYFGEGVPKDLVHAYAWYNVAQANGIEEAKIDRDRLELNAKELAEAQSLSTEIQNRIEANKKD